MSLICITFETGSAEADFCDLVIHIKHDTL